jgi:hypothetical protein
MPPPRHTEMHELSLELLRINERSAKLSVLNIKPHTDMASLVLIALKIYDSSELLINVPELLDTFKYCGKFGVVAVERCVFTSYPYVHLSDFHDTIMRLERQGHVIGNDPLKLSDTGLLLGDGLFVTASTF